MLGPLLDLTIGALLIYTCVRDRGLYRWGAYSLLVLSAVDAALDIPAAMRTGNVAWLVAETGWLLCPFVVWPLKRSPNRALAEHQALQR